MAASAGTDRTEQGATPETSNIPGGDTVAQRRVVSALARVLGGRGSGPAKLIETHISYVLLTGSHAYKIKKAVDLGFLDFRTLASRRHYCEEELRLNRRLAPAIYLDVVAIGGTAEAPVPGGQGKPIEYTVRMREFPQTALASRALARRELTGTHVSALAAVVAEFHRVAARAPVHGHLGAPKVVYGFAQQNFAQLQPLVSEPAARTDLGTLAAWTRAQYVALLPALEARRDDGQVRECHGDLHLGNIALIDDAPVVFDCIEFNDDMRWIDVMSEVAFTVMDLADRGSPGLAHRFLDAYLEITGDYGGLVVLPFYLVYRAMIRAKIAQMRRTQCPPGPQAHALEAEYATYVRLALGYARPARPGVVLMHGLSGSGKTVVSQALLEAGGAVRVRTDVERKRLAGRGPTARGGDALDADLYAPAVTKATYARALELAQEITAAGRVALIDGTFLMRWQRQMFRDWAATQQLPLVIVACRAPEAVLRERVARRSVAGHDASDAGVEVLARQLASAKPLAASEATLTVDADTDARIDAAWGARLWRAVATKLAAAGTAPATATVSAAKARGTAPAANNGVPDTKAVQ
jgi:aminoglycoside phosphotransferase family enzyme/predicted kinase